MRPQNVYRNGTANVNLRAFQCPSVVCAKHSVNLGQIAVFIKVENVFRGVLWCARYDNAAREVVSCWPRVFIAADDLINIRASWIRAQTYNKYDSVSTVPARPGTDFRACSESELE